MLEEWIKITETFTLFAKGPNIICIDQIVLQLRVNFTVMMWDQKGKTHKNTES